MKSPSKHPTIQSDKALLFFPRSVEAEWDEGWSQPIGGEDSVLVSNVTQSSAAYWSSMVEDFDAIYTGEKRSRLSVFLDHWLRKDIYDRISETVQVIQSMGDHQTVLDVGTGTGRLCLPLGERGHRTVGIDFSRSMLEKAKDLTRKAGIAHLCDFVGGDIVQAIPNELKQYRHFDVITILGVLDYISDPLPLLRKLLLFRPRKIIASFPRRGTLRCYLRQLRYKVQGLDCPLYFYNPKQLSTYGDQLQCRHTNRKTMGQLHFCVFEF